MLDNSLFFALRGNTGEPIADEKLRKKIQNKVALGEVPSGINCGSSLSIVLQARQCARHRSLGIRRQAVAAGGATNARFGLAIHPSEVHLGGADRGRISVRRWPAKLIAWVSVEGCWPPVTATEVGSPRASTDSSAISTPIPRVLRFSRPSLSHVSNPLDIFKHGHPASHERDLVGILDAHIYRLSLIIHQASI